MVDKDDLCEFCGHPEYAHYLYNEGACGDPDCCGEGLETEFCEECDHECYFAAARS